MTTLISWDDLPMERTLDRQIWIPVSSVSEGYSKAAFTQLLKKCSLELMFEPKIGSTAVSALYTE